MDINPSLISPINYHPNMFPVSTKNYFNINMDPMLLQNFLETPNKKIDFNKSLRFNNDTNFLSLSKEINMSDKILINEPDDIFNFKNKENKDLNLFKDNLSYYQEGDMKLNGNINSNCLKDLKMINAKNGYFKNFSLDMEIVNESDTPKIFSDTIYNLDDKNKNELNFACNESYTLNEKTKVNKENQILYKNFPNQNLEETKKIVFSTFYATPKKNYNLNGNPLKLGEKKDQNEVITINNTNDNLISNKKTNNEINIKVELEILNKYNSNILHVISPRASLNISPKSAFVFNKKLFK